ncbi:unnamed protein product, partial [Closterium sp. Naga37s-1]
SLARLFPRPSPSPSSTWLPPWQHREHAQGRVLLGETGHVLTAALMHHTAVHGCDDDHATYHKRQRQRDLHRMHTAFGRPPPSTAAAASAGARKLQEMPAAAAGYANGVAAFDLRGKTIPYVGGKTIPSPYGEAQTIRYGLYYLNVSLSSPAAFFPVIFETTSDMMWVPCDCNQCDTDSSLAPLSAPYYNPKKLAHSTARGLQQPSLPHRPPQHRLGAPEPLPLSTSSNASDSLMGSLPVPAAADWPSPSDMCQYVKHYDDGNTEGTLVTDVINLSVMQMGAGGVTAATSASTVPGGGQPLEGSAGSGSSVVSPRVLFGCSSLVQVQAGSLIRSPDPSISVNGLMGFGSGPRSVFHQLSSSPSSSLSSSSPSSSTDSSSQAAATPEADAAGTGAGAGQQEAVMPLAFAFCLDGGDTGGGHLAIGRSEQPADMQTAALWHRDRLPFHYINISGMSIGGRQVAGTDSLSAVDAFSLAGGTIIDSGTTFTALPPAVYTSLRDAVFSDPDFSYFSKTDLGDCTLFPSNTTLFDSVFPNLLISFGNTTWAVPPTNYLFFGGMDPTSGMELLCLAALPIVPSTRLPAIIGESWLKNFYILVDEERGLLHGQGAIPDTTSTSTQEQPWPRRAILDTQDKGGSRYQWQDNK